VCVCVCVCVCEGRDRKIRDHMEPFVVCVCVSDCVCLLVCVCMSARVCMCACTYAQICTYICLCRRVYGELIPAINSVCVRLMGCLRLVGSFKLCVFFAKESYKRDDILQKRPMILGSLLIVATT